MRCIAILLCAAAVLTGCALTEKSRKQASYHFQMGLSFLGESNYTSALVELTEAEKIDPDDPDILHRLGQAYYFKKKYEIAAEKYRKALSVKPSFSQARNDLAVAYMDLKMWDDAVREFRMVTEDLFYPDQTGAGINMALAYLGKGDAERALATIRPIVTANPGNPLAHLTLARAYGAGGRVNLAVEEYQEAIRIFPDFALAHYHLGLAFMKTGEIAAAKKSFREVVRIAPYTEIGQLAKEHIESMN